MRAGRRGPQNRTGPSRMFRQPAKAFFIAAGCVSLALATLGIFLPVLPTTPLILLAAFFFSKGSDRLHRWLLARPAVGKLIRNWEQYGLIRTRAKITATVMIVALISFTVFYLAIPWVMKFLLPLIAGGVLLFIWTRPSAPPPATRAPGDPLYSPEKGAALPG